MASVVLIGAGASFGSEESAHQTPPLGNSLFDRLEERGGIAASIPSDIKALFRTDFEKGMAQYYEYADGDIMRFQRELAHYLATFSPSDKNAYLRLIDALGTRRVIYCSLNYDLLFELSAANLGLSTLYATDSRQGHVRLIKPHGSSNFWPNIPVGMIRGSTFKLSGRADIQAPIRPLNQKETLFRCESEDSVAPAIAMYAAGKAVKISPDYVDEQQRLWATSVHAARHVFVVGVRVHPVDKHIWGTLSKTKANVTYFGLPGDLDGFVDWKNTARKKRTYFVESDFSHAIHVIRSRMDQI